MKTGITKHLSVSIAYLERLDDETLARAFNADAQELRQEIADLKQQGYEYVPCHCGNYDDKGRCIGTAKAVDSSERN